MKRFIFFFACSLALIGCRSESENNLELAKELEEKSFQDPGLDEGEGEEDDEIIVNPISHATAVINWGETTIYIDPTGGGKAFEGMDDADLVLITHTHGDHMDPKTLSELNLGSTPVIAPQSVNEELPDSLTQSIMVMNNGETINEQNLSIEAIPMYNLREEALQYHEKGVGNGYVLERNGRRIYIAGDTEDIPEMRNLENIDIAFIPMNLPYTMPVDAAADAVIDFAPKIVYPYHFRGQDGKADVERFRQLVVEGNKDIEVILAEWYPNE